MSETTDAINAAEAALEQAKQALEAQTAVQAASGVSEQLTGALQANNSTPSTAVTREEFDAIRAELNSLNGRIADFNNRSGQRI
jgi:hypothetical protein